MQQFEATFIYLLVFKLVALLTSAYSCLECEKFKNCWIEIDKRILKKSTMRSTCYFRDEVSHTIISVIYSLCKIIKMFCNSNLTVWCIRGWFSFTFCFQSFFFSLYISKEWKYAEQWYKAWTVKIVALRKWLIR